MRSRDVSIAAQGLTHDGYIHTHTARTTRTHAYTHNADTHHCPCETHLQTQTQTQTHTHTQVLRMNSEVLGGRRSYRSATSSLAAHILEINEP